MKRDEFERVIIKALYGNKDICSKVLPELNENWFNHIDNKYIVKAIIKYNTDFGTMPNVLETKKMLSDDRVLASFEQCMKIPDEHINTPYIIQEIEEHVRKQLLYNKICDIQKYVDQDVQPLESFSDSISYAESFTFDTNIGFEFFEDPKRLYQDANVNELIYKSGLKSIDDLIGGGFHEKSLSLFLSPTNVGKTLIMCSLSTNLILNGFNVLYVTFEDSENKIASRIAQNMFDVTQNQYKHMTINNFKTAFLNVKTKLKTAKSRLIIKEYPEGSINALTLKGLIKDLADKKKFKPDIILIDYIGCMIPNGRPNPTLNTNTILQRVAAETRSIGMEFGIPIISAAQTNRGGYGSADINLNDAADSFSSTMKADAIFGVTQTEELKEQGMYQVKLLKTRYGNLRGTVVTIGVDVEKQRIYDLGTNPSMNNAIVFDQKTSDKTDEIISKTLSGSNDVDLDNSDKYKGIEI